MVTKETSMSSDKVAAFGGTLAEFYDRYLVPLNFAPYAEVIAERVKQLRPRRVLETAAGSGIVTEALARTLPSDTTITATDFNQAMIDIGKARPGMARVNWQQADAMKLPFGDSAFDLVLCQFGVMFFPDRPAAFAEARRVLAPGGHLVFNTWDALETHQFGAAVVDGLRHAFPADPPTFLADIPHGYTDPARITADLAAGGLVCDSLDTITLSATAEAADVALGFCTGTPIRAEIDARGDLASTTALVQSEVRSRLGDGPVTATMTAHVIVAHRPG